MLHYVFTDKDDKVELLYFDAFTFSKQANSLRFTNGKTVYVVTRTGILVDDSGRRVDMDATSGTVSGSFDGLRRGKFENVTFQ